jgi:hypothetical protein
MEMLRKLLRGNQSQGSFTLADFGMMESTIEYRIWCMEVDRESRKAVLPE